MDVWQQYLDGFLEPTATLRTLCSDLGEVESEIGPLERQKAVLRERIAHIAARLDGQKTEVKGFGTVAMTQPGTRVSWDGKALDTLVAKLARNGYAEIAEELAAARRETATAPTLRITPEKRG